MWRMYLWNLLPKYWMSLFLPVGIDKYILDNFQLIAAVRHICIFES